MMGYTRVRTSKPPPNYRTTDRSSVGPTENARLEIDKDFTDLTSLSPNAWYTARVATNRTDETDQETARNKFPVWPLVWFGARAGRGSHYPAREGRAMGAEPRAEPCLT